LKGKILIDGIPATHFLPPISREELESFVGKLLETFSPNIIVGISDMPPPDGDIEKARMVGEIVKEYRL